MIHTLYSFYSFLFGLLVGSFLNVIILRLPQQEDYVQTRSHCPKCKAQLKWFHNIPVFSFIFLRGKCAFCAEKISWRYPLIELLTGFISLGLFPSDITGITLGYFIFNFSLACIFVCHFFIDLDHHLLLDKLNFALLVLILPYSILTFSWHHWLVGGLIGGGSTLFITWFYYKLRGQIGLGGGDIKLYAVLGLLLGPTGIITTIFGSCMIGAVVGLILIAAKRLSADKPMAFGPSIILFGSFQIFFPEYARALQILLF